MIIRHRRPNGVLVLSCPAMSLESYDVRLSVPASVSSTSLLAPIEIRWLATTRPLDAKP